MHQISSPNVVTFLVESIVKQSHASEVDLYTQLWVTVGGDGGCHYNLWPAMDHVCACVPHYEVSLNEPHICWPAAAYSLVLMQARVVCENKTVSMTVLYTLL